MGENRGKQFEKIIQKSFEIIPNVSIDRLFDSTNGYAGVKTVSDFIVFRKPYQYYFELKAIHGNTLNFNSHITEFQWKGLIQKSKIDGVNAGIICWFIEHDETWFLPINVLERLKLINNKSFHIKWVTDTDISDNIGFDRKEIFKIKGKKKRIFFEYDMESFLNNLMEV